MKLTASQRAMLKKHSVHHSKEHMALMNNLMRSGKSFKEAHKQAQAKVGK
jgi:hypothetical protein|tara:strand:- start:421 stop:570 length:150 start_codon:yes stop_codon:yes gene_type:complete